MEIKQNGGWESYGLAAKRLLVTPFRQYFQESRVEDWMEYKKLPALSAGYSFSTFEKEGILGKVCWLQWLLWHSALKTKHDPGFLIFFLLFKGKKNIPRNL